MLARSQLDLLGHMATTLKKGHHLCGDQYPPTILSRGPNRNHGRMDAYFDKRVL